MRRAHSLLAAIAIACGASGAQADEALRRAYDAQWAPRMVPLLAEVLRFPTIAGRTQAFADQQAWLTRVAGEFGFVLRDRGMVTEVELPGPPSAPVLGLAVHGDVQPVDGRWSVAPFAGVVKDGKVWGRGAADDKGPLVQALLAMKTLADSNRARTHTIRLLVGSDEEIGSSDMRQYRKAHAPPDITLVLDSQFPVVIGERAWNTLTVEALLAARGAATVSVTNLRGGLGPSIVADAAHARLQAANGPDALEALRGRLTEAKLPPGTTLDVKSAPRGIEVNTRGKAAHVGLNADGGRNAIVALAQALTPQLPEGGARDLLAFAQLAGQDLHGSGLGLTQVDPRFGRAIAAPTLLRTLSNGRARLTINIRSNPNLSGAALKKFLFEQVAAFNEKTGAALVPGGIFGERALAFDPQAKLVKRLVAAYRRASGRDDAPAVSGGGTYAKSLPNAIAFGMAFPDTPYTGHDVDEHVRIDELHRGTHVLIEALADLACSAPLREPFKP